MSRKLVLFILSLSLILSFSLIQNVNGTWYIRGWIGKYLAIGHIAVDKWEPIVNKTITFEIFLQNFEDLFVKTIDVRIKIKDEIYNETLAKDAYWEKPENALAGAMYELVKLTPHEGGFLSIYIHADYQYNEGNQTLEQSGTFELVNVVEVKYDTYSSVRSENRNLRYEIYSLNSTIQDLNVSYSTLETWTYFLAFTTFALTVATLFAVTFYKRKQPM